MSSIRQPSLSEQQYVNNQARWQKDEEVTKCDNCHALFTFFKRRHHCRCCGNIFCQDCTSNFVRYDKHRVRVIKRPEFAIDEFAPYRTCDSCYDNLLHLGLIIRVPSSSSSSSRGNNNPDDEISQDTLDDSSLSINNDTDALNSSNISGFPINMEDTTSENDTSNKRTINTTQICTNNANNGSRTETSDTNTINSGQDQQEGESDDNNTCPICNVDFKKISPEHDNNIIEQHVEECIRRAERIQQHHNSLSSNGSGNDIADCNNNGTTHNDDSTCPTARNRMLVYKIPYPKNKKGQLLINNNNDYEECPICLEQMLPGQKVGRLECLCIFHYHCIKSWFVKKSQQVAAIEGINKIGRNFCPLHDAIF